MMELLERESELEALNAALAKARRGEGSLALINGEAGIGKTSLVDRFTHRRPQSVRLFWGACDALFTPRPLGPLHDMAPQIGGEVQSLLLNDPPRGRIFSALLSELGRHPVIAVFEDVHWADEATFDLLRFLGRRISRTSALLVLTYRDDELEPRHPLRSVLGDFASLPAARRLELSPLSEQAVGQLIGEGNLTAAALHRQTGGNPFFVTEVLATPKGGVPATIRDAVLARLARLSASGHAVLEAAAVVGPRIEPWLLTEVTGAEAPAVEESLAAGVLLAWEGELTFRHELARQAILEAISPPRRQVLNRLVLDTLSSSAETRSDLARLVHHAEAARDREAVVRLAPPAAREASSAGAHRAAAVLFQLALEYGADLPKEAQAQLLEEHARESIFIDDVSSAVESRQKAVELWRAAQDPLKEGENLAFLAMAFNMVERWTDGAAASQEAIRILEPLQPGRELAVAYRIRALNHLFRHDYEEALPLAERAAELAQQTGDVIAMAMSQDTLGVTWMYLDYTRGCQIMEAALEMAIEAGLDARAATLYANLGSISCMLHHFRKANETLIAGLAFTEDRDLDHLRQYLMAWYGITLLQLGRWVEAEEVADNVLNRTHLSSQSSVAALVLRGRLQSRSGKSSFQPTLDEALEIARRSDQFQHLAPVLAARAEAFFLAGNLERLLEETEPILEQAIEKRHGWIAGELVYWRWRSGQKVEILEWLAGPYRLELQGDWTAAALAWAELDCPYEQARALADGDQAAQIQALRIFEQLGAQPMAGAVREQLHAAGLERIPRGPRQSTRLNPFGLTNRQMEILDLLAEQLTNAQIAERLHISPKTVDHHVSAILSKMDVTTRQAAADIARREPPPPPK